MTEPLKAVASMSAEIYLPRNPAQYQLSEFQPNQWWLTELWKIGRHTPLTDDQYRATKTALALADAVFAERQNIYTATQLAEHNKKIVQAAFDAVLHACASYDFDSIVANEISYLDPDKILKE